METCHKKQYGSYYKRWMHFCIERQIDTINPSVGNVVAFLTDLYDEGLSYSAINTAKSMLSSSLEIIHKRDIGKEVLIRRFMKGIFHLRPVIGSYMPLPLKVLDVTKEQIYVYAIWL